MSGSWTQRILRSDRGETCSRGLPQRPRRLVLPFKVEGANDASIFVAFEVVVFERAIDCGLRHATVAQIKFDLVLVVALVFGFDVEVAVSAFDLTFTLEVIVFDLEFKFSTACDVLGRLPRAHQRIGAANKAHRNNYHQPSIHCASL